MSKYAQYELMKYKCENGNDNMLNQITMGYYYNLARGTMEIIRLRDALSCLRDAVDRRSRRPKGRTMQPKGG